MHADHDMIGMQIPGTGAGVGAPLVSHKGACCVSRGDVCVLAHSRCPSTGVAKVAFTGSVATGARIMGMCAPDVRAVSLELGGKSPVLVFPDADIDKAVEPNNTQPNKYVIPPFSRPEVKVEASDDLHLQRRL